MFSKILSRFSLRSVLIINVIIPLIFAIAAAAYLGLRAMEHTIEQRLQEDVQLVARAIRLPVSYSLEKERFGSVSQALQSVFHIGRVYGAYIYDAQGEQIAAVGAVEPEKRQKDLKEVVEGGERKGKYEKIQGRRVYSYFVPLFDTTGNSNGLLQITRKKSDFEDYIQRLRILVAAIFAGTGLFVSGFVLLGFHRAAGRYFTELTRSMARVQEGERSHRAELKGPKEIVTLARSLNGMLDSVDRSEEEIDKRRKEQETLENKLRESEKMAAIGQLAAGVAHELGAPLSLIDGKAQRCLRDKDMKAAHGQSLQDIRQQVQRMSEIVRQLLDFGKGAMQERRWARTAQLVGSAVATVKKEIGERTDFHIEGPSSDPWLYVDPLRFEQALINLLRNAAQAEETTRVRITWELNQFHEVVFLVEDDGPGIAEEVKPKIFEPFFSTRKNGKNTGMGLSVVHGIIQEHEGTIQLMDSELGGAGFRLVLPMQSKEPQLEQGE
ncbi:MAG: HAMP domain-containing protein [Desulfobacterales bacterium]|nr:HAMP domain-containing protein [Desulfobacterales bacterium]